MAETIKQKVSCYTMKMQIYPSPAQKERIDKIFRALHIAYNITFHEAFLKNPLVCTEPNKDGAVWPDFRKMAKKEWRHYLIECNPAVAEAPADSLMNNNGLFLLDAKRAWETGMNKHPIDAKLREEFRFYNSGKPRNSFLALMPSKNLKPSEDNFKVAWITIPGVKGAIKARGFNHKVWFGENRAHTYSEAQAAEELAPRLTIRVSKDRCGSYYVSVTISDGKKHDREIYLEMPAVQKTEPVGIDVGIKDVAILSNGEKIENKHFKKEKDASLRRMNKKLSRRWGPANIAYRDYNADIRKENRQNPEMEPKPTAKPSKRYLKTINDKARLERKIARRRDAYYHQQTAKITRQSSMIAVETLMVKNMLRNHKLAYALTDAAMSDFVSKLKYKSERLGIELRTIGTFEPSSQLCSKCGELYPKAKNLSIRRWKCPACGAEHDRDINAATNIVAIALKNGSVEDIEHPPDKDASAVEKRSRKRSEQTIFPDEPDLVIIFSKQHTKLNDPRYVIYNKKTSKIIDDAQGAGYRSISNAKNCFKAKRKWAECS